MSNNAEQYTVKTAEEFLKLHRFDTTHANVKLAANMMSAYASELIKENERLKGTIGVECVKQLSELKKALAELLRFEGSIRYATTNALNEPGNFNKALDRVIELLQPKKDETTSSGL